MNQNQTNRYYDSAETTTAAWQQPKLRHLDIDNTETGGTVDSDGVMSLRS